MMISNHSHPMDSVMLLSSAETGKRLPNPFAYRWNLGSVTEGANGDYGYERLCGYQNIESGWLSFTGCSWATWQSGDSLKVNVICEKDPIRNPGGLPGNPGGYPGNPGGFPGGNPGGYPG